MNSNKPPIVHILSVSEIPSALTIAYTELGSDYLTKNDFLETLDADDSFCMVSTHDGTVSGFSICKIFGPDRMDEILALPDCDERDILMGFDTIGLLGSVAVAHEMKGKGIGGELLDACYKELVSRGAKVICAMAWKGVNGITNIEGILVRLGMLPHVEIKGYWNRFVPSPEGHACPICGRPCKCSAVLYLKKSS